MPLDQAHKDYLRNCNCIVEFGDGWMVAEKRGEEFFSPFGIRIVDPEGWIPASHEEIIKKIEAVNDMAVMMWSDVNAKN